MRFHCRNANDRSAGCVRFGGFAIGEISWERSRPALAFEGRASLISGSRGRVPCALLVDNARQFVELSRPICFPTSPSLWSDPSQRLNPAHSPSRALIRPNLSTSQQRTFRSQVFRMARLWPHIFGVGRPNLYPELTAPVHLEPGWSQPPVPQLTARFSQLIAFEL
jgi:hypothetical protein